VAPLLARGWREHVVTIAIEPHSNLFSWSFYREVQAPLKPGLDALTKYQIGLQAVPRLHGDSSGNFTFASVNVRVTLLRVLSWVVIGRKTQDLLNHEELHFRIAVLVGRELDAEITALTARSGPQLLAAGTALHTTKVQRAQTIEDAYDAATQHGRISGQQDIWAHRVDAWERNSFKIKFP
jgi:hypothetical protein